MPIDTIWELANEPRTQRVLQVAEDGISQRGASLWLDMVTKQSYACSLQYGCQLTET
jgi:hypothetical protein